MEVLEGAPVKESATKKVGSTSSSEEEEEEEEEEEVSQQPVTMKKSAKKSKGATLKAARGDIQTTDTATTLGQGWQED